MLVLARKVTVGLGIIWLLSLGLFVELHLESYDILGDDRREAFFSGNKDVYVNVSVRPTAFSETGIRYLFSYASPEPPYHLQLGLNFLENRNVSEVKLSNIEVKNSSRGTFQIISSDNPIIEDLELSNMPENNMWQTIIYLPSAVNSLENFKMKISGIATDGGSGNVLPFADEFEVHLKRTSYVYVGWYKLLYLNSFFSH